MKYAVLPLLVSGLFLTACNDESKTEKSENVVITPAPVSCLKPATFTYKGVTYTLAEIDTNENGCIDQAEIDALPEPEPEPTPDPVDTSAWEVESNNIQTQDVTYPVITGIKLTGSTDYVVASGIDGIEDGTHIAQLNTSNDGDFKIDISATHSLPRPAGAKLLMFFSNKSADFFLTEGGNPGEYLQNTGTTDLELNCQYDGTHTGMKCEGFTLDQSDKFTEIPVIGKFVVLGCAVVDSDLSCENGGDVYVQFN